MAPSLHWFFNRKKDQPKETTDATANHVEYIVGVV